MSGEFDSRKDSHPVKLEQRLGIWVKLSFRELNDPKVSELRSFDNMDILLSHKRDRNREGML